jgi:NADPH-dependent curcumin reductase CurA
MVDVNRSWRLAARPQGMIKDSDFTWREDPVPEHLGEGEILVVSGAEGLESAPAALRRLFTGANLGKQRIKVAD